MAFLAGYFDESGTHDDSSIVVVAGVVSSTQQWLKFDRKWRNALDAENLSTFHMTDFENRQGQFKDWPLEKKRPSSSSY